MAKLYRLIPDSLSVLRLSDETHSIKEDLYYRIGKIDCYNYNFFDLLVGEEITSETSDNKKFFFNSPWSCIRGLNFINSKYYKIPKNPSDIPRIARILEYDIPDEILTQSEDVYTYSDGFQGKGKLVPLQLLQQGAAVLTYLDRNTKKHLTKMIIDQVEEHFEILKKLNPSDNYKKYFTAQDLQFYLNWRFAVKDSFFESDIITNRSMTITDQDFRLLDDIKSGKRIEEDLKPLIERSGGILSIENLRDYDFDNPSYKKQLKPVSPKK